MTDIKPARIRDGTLYEGIQRYSGNGVLRSCAKCHAHQPTGGFRKTRYGMTCARCVEAMKEQS